MQLRGPFNVITLIIFSACIIFKVLTTVKNGVVYYNIHFVEEQRMLSVVKVSQFGMLESEEWILVF